MDSSSSDNKLIVEQKYLARIKTAASSDSVVAPCPHGDIKVVSEGWALAEI